MISHVFNVDDIYLDPVDYGECDVDTGLEFILNNETISL